MGPPGSGKTTQAKRASDEFGIKHVETGRILRSIKSLETEYGKPGQYIDRGEKPPDEMVSEIVQEILPELDGFVLDGYPRSKDQAEFLENLGELDLVIHLKISDKSVIKRLTNRTREDDDPRAIRSRLEAYKTDTEPLIQFYEMRALLFSVDAERRPEVVWDEIQNCIEEICS